MFRKKQSGVALVTVILMCALLISLYLRFLDDAGLQARIDARQDQVMQARWAAMAGIEFAMSLIFSDKNKTDSYSENWANISSKTYELPLIVGGASCAVRITDESSKANINLIEESALTSTLEFYDLGITASSSILGEDIKQGASARLAQHILDYIDSDDAPRAMGAESAQYIELGKLPPANKPMNDIKELLEIPGITNEIFLASGTRPGLSDLFTVYGDNLINVNDAFEGLIKAIPGLPETYNTARRKDFYSKLLKKIPFSRLAGFTNFIVDYDWNIKNTYSQRFVTYTTWFKIEAHAQYGDANRWVTALVKRERNGKCHIVRYVEIP